MAMVSNAQESSKFVCKWLNYFKKAILQVGKLLVIQTTLSPLENSSNH